MSLRDATITFNYHYMQCHSADYRCFIDGKFAYHITIAHFKSKEKPYRILDENNNPLCVYSCNKSFCQRVMDKFIDYLLENGFKKYKGK